MLRRSKQVEFKKWSLRGLAQFLDNTVFLGGHWFKRVLKVSFKTVLMCFNYLSVVHLVSIRLRTFSESFKRHLKYHKRQSRFMNSVIGKQSFLSKLLVLLGTF